MIKRELNQGFTLVEMLVVLFIFSMVISLVMFGFEQGRSQWLRTLNENQGFQESYKKFKWLNSAFNQAIASNFQIEFSDSSPYFKGNEKSVSFLSESPILGGPGTYAWIEIKQRLSTEGDKSIVYYETPNADPYYGTYHTEQTKELILFEHVDEYKWSFYIDDMADGPNGGRIRVGRHWANEFDSYDDSQMPVLIKLNVKLNNGEGYDWPFKVTQFTRSADIGSRVEVK